MYTPDGSKMFVSGDWQPNPMRIDGLLEDRVFYHAEPITIDEILLMPITVRGYWDAIYFQGWPGIGYSRAPFKMKAYIDQNGQVWRPAFAYYADDDSGSQYHLNHHAYLVPVNVPATVQERII